MKRIALSIAALALLTSCSEIPREAWFNRGTPESLLDVSSEVVNVNIAEPSGIDELTGWINQDAPTRAELRCDASEFSCRRAREVLTQFNVKYRQMPEAKGSVSLYYERVSVRDCENRYIDNSINPYNLSHPTFGCSNASNMVQMVSDKRQFVNPDLHGHQDGEKAVQTYRAYEAPARKGNGNGSGSGPMGSIIRGSDGKGLQ